MLNQAIDNGNYDVELEDLRKATSQRRAMDFIRETLPSRFLREVSAFTLEDDRAVNKWFEGLNRDYHIHVKNHGLCLLLAWTIDMMQRAYEPRAGK